MDTVNRNLISERGETKLPGDVFCQPVITIEGGPIDSGLELIGIPKLWEKTKGGYKDKEGKIRPVRIGFLDTGVDATHPAITSRLAGAKDFTGSPYGTQDLHGHGTWVYSICFGYTNDYEGICTGGMGFMAKVLSDSGTGNNRAMYEGAKWLMEECGVDIISCSAGGMGLGSEFMELISTWTKKEHKAFFASAGNNGQLGTDTMTEPAVYAPVISVGAADWQGNLQPFSSIGPALDLVAPGKDIIACIPIAKGGKGRMSGTSMACPIVAGIYALCLAKHLDIRTANATDLDTTADILEHLKRTCIDKGTGGRDDLYGYGMIDPVKLFQDMEGKEAPPAPQPTDLPINGSVLFSFRPPSMSRYTLIETEQDIKVGSLVKLT